MKTSQIRLIVEPSAHTFTGYRVTVKWTNYGLLWRSCSFTSWSATLRFLATNGADAMDSFVVHSEIL